MFKPTPVLNVLKSIIWLGNTYASKPEMKAVGEAAIRKHYDENPSLEVRGAEIAVVRYFFLN